MQVLADIIDLPCRIAKGCKYCNRDDAASCLVRFGLDRYDTSDCERAFIFLFSLLFVSGKTIIAPNVSQNIRLMTWKICFGFREYLVDLVGKPGHLWEPDSLLNGPSSISISSPLRFPRPKPVEPAVDFRLLAKQYFSDSQSLNLVFDPASGIPIQKT
jgi:serine/threonine-protein kinase CTR1